ncbi:hypothetical protein AB0L44_28565 [Nonomuraea wenchangensis]|uniref:hypothetical protein n=1 Tax=Nonomuraea wenchangensis TaxID=568860 RepID=UPI0034420C2F
MYGTRRTRSKKEGEDAPAHRPQAMLKRAMRRQVHLIQRRDGIGYFPAGFGPSENPYDTLKRLTSDASRAAKEVRR